MLQRGYNLLSFATPVRTTHDRAYMFEAVRLQAAAAVLHPHHDDTTHAVDNAPVLQHAAVELRADKTFMLAVVREHGEALGFAAPPLLRDRAFLVSAAINAAARDVAARALGGMDALLELERAATSVCRAKVVLIGHGAAGKTCLRHYLQRYRFHEQLVATDGVEMDEWIVSTGLFDERGNERMLHVSLWDLGGQEEYLATHPFFFDNQSIFCLCAE